MLDLKVHHRLRPDEAPVERASEYWSNDSSSDEAFFSHSVISRFERFSEQGWRGLICTDTGGGTVDRVRINANAEVGVANFVLPNFDRQVIEVDQSMIFLVASLTANLSFKVEGHERVILNRPELALIRVPKNSKLTVKIPAKVRQQRLIGLFRL